MSSAKAKGRELQQFVCSEIADSLGFSYNQSDDSCPIHSREMGQSGVDIILRTKFLKAVIPFSIECKATEQVNIRNTIYQADRNKYSGTDWAIVLKGKITMSNPVVILPWTGWRRLIETYIDNHKAWDDYDRSKT